MEKYRTLPQVFLESCEKWSSKPALLKKVRNEFVPIRYGELREKVYELARALSECDVKAGDVVAIMAENSAEWAMVDWAIMSLGAITVPIYPTLLYDQVAYILKDSCAKIAIAGDKKISEKLEKAANENHQPLFTVLISGAGEGYYDLDRLVKEGKDKDFTMQEWVARCKEIHPEDVATIIYTSGTTGEPKGAVLPHKAFTFLCESIRKNLPIDHKDRFLSFLPLSHVYERMAGHFLPISCGAEIAYAESLRTVAQDMILAKPTILLTVPRFLDAVRHRILTAVEEGTKIKQWLFREVLLRGKRRLANQLRPVGLFGGVLDKLVASKVRERFGGRLRFMVSGGAALPPDLAEFFGAFGILVLQGYGLTETAPVISVNHPERNRYDSVGEILEGLEVRIAGDGEILVRGPSVMLRYHNKPKETAEAIDEDGWFHTGDLGRLEGKRLWITGRKKDIIVMANGKNVSPERIENLLRSSPYVDEVMVIGDDMDYIAALIVPNFELLKHMCEGKGLGCAHWTEVVEYPQVLELYRAEVDKVNAQLPDYERVKRFRLVPEKWSPETGELTPSLKVKRKFVTEKYPQLIQELKR